MKTNISYNVNHISQRGKKWALSLGKFSIFQSTGKPKKSEKKKGTFPSLCHGLAKYLTEADLH